MIRKVMRTIAKSMRLTVKSKHPQDRIALRFSAAAIRHQGGRNNGE
jgi:hypothetical protein